MADTVEAMIIAVLIGGIIGVLIADRIHIRSMKKLAKEFGLRNPMGGE